MAIRNLGLFLVAAATLTTAPRALACMCSPLYIGKEFAGADAVFVGRFRGETPLDQRPNSGLLSRQSFDVSKVYKGKPATKLDLIDESSSCSNSFEEGAQYLVWAYKNAELGGALTTHLCTLTEKIDAAHNYVNWLENVAPMATDARPYKLGAPVFLGDSLFQEVTAEEGEPRTVQFNYLRSDNERFFGVLAQKVRFEGETVIGLGALTTKVSEVRDRPRTIERRVTWKDPATEADTKRVLLLPEACGSNFCTVATPGPWTVSLPRVSTKDGKTTLTLRYKTCTDGRADRVTPVVKRLYGHDVPTYVVGVLTTEGQDYCYNGDGSMKFYTKQVKIPELPANTRIHLLTPF